MIVHDFEDWLIGMSLAVALAVPLGFQLLSAPLAGDAQAAIRHDAQYAITVTAKRIPAACKGLTGTRPASCAGALDGETTMTMEARN